jgi:phosphomevalonate kinase
VTRARAPGKVVLSGAYSVLAGAPAIVSTVSRYVTADTSRSAQLVTDEVRMALRAGELAPFFDASQLRQDDRKLGLGSSAAILVASLFAIERRRNPEAALSSVRAQVFARALEAHRAAQGGGSGVDVASCTFGGTLVYRLSPTAPLWSPVELPETLHIEIWTCPTSASTRELLAAVARLEAHSPSEHARWLEAQAAAATRAAECVVKRDAAGLVAALTEQYRALSGLGRAASVPIVTPELEELGPLAAAEASVLLPAGAGGGDIAIFVGASASSPGLRRALTARAHELLPADLSVSGVSELTDASHSPAAK